MLTRYAGWPRDAIELVERACARHGGWERYETMTEIAARVAFIDGPLPRLKGLGRTYENPRVVRVEPRVQATTFVDWPRKGSTGRFESGHVRITSAPEPSSVSRAHRARVSRYRWKPFDALYFFGYALANYWALPFLLASASFVRASERSVTVDFPPGFDTHSRRQSFHFDASALLVRHDYTADVAAWWATGSHYSSDYVEAGGLRFAQRRVVRARLGSWVTPLVVLHARLEDFEIRR